jgi:cell fate regulator YaaT (PSP1 superfamily)
MPRVVSVCFRRAGRGYRFDAGDLDVKPGDRVVARTARGIEIGAVRTSPTEMPAPEGEAELRSIVRTATEDDLRKDEENAAREREAMEVAVEQVAKHGLPMKLIEAQITLDRSRIVIHFSAEGRVDFRALVRDLARALRARVELHQVGVRDEAKMRGGLGHCGRLLCCATFLTHFDPVGIKMAKEQDISLNPQKISGVCGRLMCCLNFEYAHYREAKQCLPKTGSRVETDRGPGKLTEVNVLRNRVVVALDEGGHLELPTAAVARHQPGCPHLAAAQDGDVLDPSPPETQVPDPQPRETQTPETQTPETQTPDAHPRDSQPRAPEPRGAPTPDAQAPVGQTPDAKASGTQDSRPQGARPQSRRRRRYSGRRRRPPRPEES